jgi:hypothetical protein
MFYIVLDEWIRNLLPILYITYWETQDNAGWPMVRSTPVPQVTWLVS